MHSDFPLIPILDPDLQPSIDSPYARLARLGLTPDSTREEVLAAGFRLSIGVEGAKDRAAWDELRDPQKRLHADFFLSWLPLLPEELLEALWTLPAPVELAVFCQEGEERDPATS